MKHWKRDEALKIHRQGTSFCYRPSDRTSWWSQQLSLSNHQDLRTQHIFGEILLSDFGDYIIHPITGWWFGTFFILPYIGKNHPNWRTPSFFRGVGQPPTRSCQSSFFHISSHLMTYRYGMEPDLHQSHLMTKVVQLTASGAGSETTLGPTRVVPTGTALWIPWV